MTLAIILTSAVVLIAARYFYSKKAKKDTISTETVDSIAWDYEQAIQTPTNEPEEDKLMIERVKIAARYQDDIPADTPIAEKPVKKERKKREVKPKTVKTTTAKKATKKAK